MAVDRGRNEGNADETAYRDSDFDCPSSQEKDGLPLATVGPFVEVERNPSASAVVSTLPPMPLGLVGSPSLQPMEGNHVTFPRHPLPGQPGLAPGPAGSSEAEVLRARPVGDAPPYASWKVLGKDDESDELEVEKKKLAVLQHQQQQQQQQQGGQGVVHVSFPLPQELRIPLCCGRGCRCFSSSPGQDLWGSSSYNAAKRVNLSLNGGFQDDATLASDVARLRSAKLLGPDHEEPLTAFKGPSPLYRSASSAIHAAGDFQGYMMNTAAASSLQTKAVSDAAAMAMRSVIMQAAQSAALSVVHSMASNSF